MGRLFGALGSALWLGFGMTGLTLVAVPRSASGPDALRQLARCPRVDLQVTFGFNAARGFVINDPERPAAEVTAARGALQLSPEDPKEWLHLGTWLAETGDTNGATAALDHAVGLLRTRIDRNPMDDDAQASLGEALSQSGQSAEAERVLRSAVETNPTGWRSRVGLGQTLDTKWLNPQPGATTPAGVAEGSAGSSKGEWQSEASRLLDRAVELAPREPLVFRARGFHRFAVAQDTAGDRATGAGPVNGSAAALAACGDYWQAATLARTNVLSWGVAGFTELVARVGTAAGEGTDLAGLPAESQQHLVAAFQALEGLAATEDTRSAAAALEVRGILQFLTRGRAGALATLRRAVALDPGRYQAWEILLALMVTGEDRDGLRELCRERVRVRPAARNHLLLAKACERTGRLTEALEEAREAARLSPQNPQVQMTVVSLRLRTSTDPESMDGISTRLQEIATHLDRMPKTPEWFTLAQHFVPTVCIYQGLIGNTEEARRMVGEWMKTNSSDTWAREIQSALGQ